jgi:hypothetical protein
MFRVLVCPSQPRCKNQNHSIRKPTPSRVHRTSLQHRHPRRRRRRRSPCSCNRHRVTVDPRTVMPGRHMASLRRRRLQKVRFLGFRGIIDVDFCLGSLFAVPESAFDVRRLYVLAFPTRGPLQHVPVNVASRRAKATNAQRGSGKRQSTLWTIARRVCVPFLLSPLQPAREIFSLM